MSPAYDLNPNELADGLSLNISWDNNALDYELVKSVAEDFRVTPLKRDEIIGSIKKVIKDWKKIAEQLGIPRTERQRMESAFKY